MDALRPVVIPSCSGLRFSQEVQIEAGAGRGRNPFLFRAAVLASRGMRCVVIYLGRNPFLFRAAVLAGLDVPESIIR